MERLCLIRCRLVAHLIRFNNFKILITKKVVIIIIIMAMRVTLIKLNRIDKYPLILLI